MMVKVFILLVITYILIGCTSSKDKATIIKEIQEKCDGKATFSVTLSSWGDSITSSCTEDKTK